MWPGVALLTEFLGLMLVSIGAPASCFSLLRQAPRPLGSQMLSMSTGGHAHALGRAHQKASGPMLNSSCLYMLFERFPGGPLPVLPFLVKFACCHTSPFRSLLLVAPLPVFIVLHRHGSFLLPGCGAPAVATFSVEKTDGKNP